MQAHHKRKQYLQNRELCHIPQQVKDILQRMANLKLISPTTDPVKAYYQYPEETYFDGQIVYIWLTPSWIFVTQNVL